MPHPRVHHTKEVNKKLTWSVIFDDVKAGGEGEECDMHQLGNAMILY